MKQLIYNKSDNEIKIDYPEEWVLADLTAVAVVIKNTKGVIIQASGAATMYPATTLDGAVERYADTIILDSGATALETRDSLTLVGAGGSEVVRVKGYDASTFTATLEEPTKNEYSDEDVVLGHYATITVDTTDTDVFQLGIEAQVLWRPAGTGTETKELYDIAKFAMDLVSLRSRFKDKYERAYKAFTSPTDKFANIANEAESEVTAEFEGSNVVYDRIVGQERNILLIMAKMAIIWTMNGDDQIEDERAFLIADYDKRFARIENDPIWTDNNQDDVKDENEVQRHNHIFERAW